jgi:broad specificity phosphatase PhoE
VGAIVLCRHGVTAGNAAGQFLSRTDLHLSDAGEAQCRALQPLLSKFAFEHCLISPMSRCVRTRELAAPEVPFETLEALREVDFGSWEGMTLQWVQGNDARRLSHRQRDPVNFRPPAGESFADVANRLSPVVARLQGATCSLVIAHRGTLGVLERLLRGLPLHSQEVRPLEPAEFRALVV